MYPALPCPTAKLSRRVSNPQLSNSYVKFLYLNNIDTNQYTNNDKNKVGTEPFTLSQKIKLSYLIFNNDILTNLDNASNILSYIDIYDIVDLNAISESTKYITYDDNLDRIILSKSLSNTFKLDIGESLTALSAGYKLFLNDNNNNICWFPPYGGIKNQDLIENQDKTGIIPVNANLYGTNLDQNEYFGTSTASNIQMLLEVEFNINFSLFGFDYIIGESIGNTEFLFYKMYFDTTLIYDDYESGNIYSDGDTITFFAKCPIDNLLNKNFKLIITKASSLESTQTIIMVKESITVSYPYLNIYNREIAIIPIENISDSYYYESINFILDVTGSTIILNNINTGVVSNTYAINELYGSIYNNIHIQVSINNSPRIIIKSLNLPSTYINNSLINPDINIAINQLNMFLSSSCALVLPTITSPDIINIVVGSNINFIATADNGVVFNWVGLPIGVYKDTENSGRILGGSTLSVGVYNFTLECINYQGSVSLPMTLNVNSSLIIHSSIFNTYNQYVDIKPSNLLPININDPWSITIDFRKYVNNIYKQQIIYFDIISLVIDNNIFIFKYGDDTDYIELSFPPVLSWNHILITYDGGSTKNIGNETLSYSRFKIYHDGVILVTTKSHGNYGYDGLLNKNLFRLGADDKNNNNLHNGYYNNLAIWDSDQSSNALDIYNTTDYTSLTIPPNHWFVTIIHPIMNDLINPDYLGVLHNMTEYNLIN